MDIILNVKPVPKPRMTRSDKWKKRPAVVAYHNFKDELRVETRKHHYELGDELSVWFFIAMPKSWSKKKQAEMWGQPHQQKPDLDNLVKAFKDAMLEDDSKVWKYSDIRKIWWNEDCIEIKNYERDTV
jgi:Holliday junction resolvase RusA-like endonuclease